MENSRVVIQLAKMPGDMQVAAVNTASFAFANYRENKDIAKHIGKEFDRMYGTRWHCIVGPSFSAHVWHDKNCYIKFSVGQDTVVLIKFGK
ncbi:unnamed protein product [Cyprideis torosa]|uniref:Dynein light chain n=1 Tax=Cyprideis torosa TaxID=163714 RepID=A0A7R8ZSZ1_9CRUS|nr:unnamed protein product [Cyprideis torosa]CAG0907419.1 unnamed protein product [Cyprideis torosa]